MCQGHPGREAGKSARRGAGAWIGAAVVVPLYLLRYPVQRSFSHTSPSLNRIRPCRADFDSMWRGSALFSVAAGHRLDAERGEAEERIAERRTHAASESLHSQNLTCKVDLRKQLRKPVAAESGKYLGYCCEVTSSDINRSQAPHQLVSRLVAPLSGAGRLTAFWGLAGARNIAGRKPSSASRFVADFRAAWTMAVRPRRSTIRELQVALHAATLLSFE